MRDYNDMKADLWMSVYTAVIKSIYLNDKTNHWNGLESVTAQTAADNAVRDFESRVEKA